MVFTGDINEQIEIYNTDAIEDKKMLIRKNMNVLISLDSVITTKRLMLWLK